MTAGLIYLLIWKCFSFKVFLLKNIFLTIKNIGDFNLDFFYSLTMSHSIFILLDQVLDPQRKVPEEEEVGIVERVFSILNLTAQTV